MAYWLEGAPARPVARQQRQSVPSSGFIQTTRARLRLALVICLGVTALVTFVVFPPRRVTVSFDGRQTTLLSRNGDVSLLLKDAGVQNEAGDLVVKDSNGIRVQRAIPVVVNVDGRTLAWRTRSATVKTLLEEMGIDLSPYDAVLFNGLPVSPDQSLVEPTKFAAVPLGPLGAFGKGESLDGYEVTVRRAVPLTIVEDGQVIGFKSAGQTVGAALADAGIRLGPADDVYPVPEEALVAGEQVTVKHASAINLHIGDTTRVLYTQVLTLKDALAEVGLTLGSDDRVEPGLDTPVTNDMSARLVRVTGREILESDPLTHKTVFKPDETLAGTATRTVQGHDGVHVRQYRMVIEDGVEKQKEFVKEYDNPPVQDTVIYYAASTLRATGLPATNLDVKDTLHVYATWYNAASSGRAPTDPNYAITYSGVPVVKGIVAVDPAVIPLGTRLFIPGYGFAVAGDTGGGIHGNMIDLGYPDGVTPDWHTGWVDIFILAPE